MPGFIAFLCFLDEGELRDVREVLSFDASPMPARLLHEGKGKLMNLSAFGREKGPGGTGDSLRRKWHQAQGMIGRVRRMIARREIAGSRLLVLDDPDYSLVKALQTAQQNFVITDPTLPDNPIVFASQGFLELTGYRLDQVLGRNCRFLQGPDTDPKAVERIQKAIESGMDTSVCLRNYRADGAMFWNQFFIAALRDSEGAVINYVGVQCKVDEDFVRAIQKKNAEEEGEEDEEVDDEERSDGDDKTT